MRHRILVPFSSFDPNSGLHGLARKQGLASGDFTGEHDHEGIWWHNMVPAGQTPGCAARPTTSANRRRPGLRW